ncbi:TonB-dependent receptor [Novosphingobium beihaiensis]|uniref:TonB-dependent receptor n=1 Tax=Novosphingobium beihaiensis TaxID=2930389 RepID=A0ABT0BUS9_9SPHN|nr:TonB-dependent receptor [Novosphingobium beihaiensis]MCJ2188832.1 TonB-dependent receptor [Novosphingobium beihaiensis]
MRRLKYLILAGSMMSAPALAQDGEERHGHDTSAVHGEQSRDILVTADYVDDLNVIGGISVLSGDDLVRDVRGQIGDTLTALPGVSATSFSPGASRPVLRGFQGERIRVLTDGLGSLDVSNTSTDHGVTIDPLTAERIEVLRGPAVLLFGSQAIGGAVNVIDRRIPRSMPEDGFHLDAQGGFGSAADDVSAGAAADFSLAPNIVAHVDGSYRHANDLRVGGFVLSPELRAEQRAVATEETEEGHLDEAEEASELANLRGRVPNSGVETYTLGGGLALINDGGSLGFSVGYYDSNYGVPSRPGAEHHHEEGDHDEDHEGEDHEEEGHEHGEEAVTIGMKQWRADVRGQINVDGDFLDAVRVRMGYADYEHTEFEGEEIGTVFRSDAYEGRLELVQANRGGWRGVTGFQGFIRDFKAIGAEAFVPPNRTAQLAVFTIQELQLGALGLELAGRYEHTSVRADAVRIGLGEDAPVIGSDRAFNAFSGAAGLTYDVAPDVEIGINGSRVTRAPSAEELLPNGPHIATQAFEIGNPNFKMEKSWGVEGYVRGSSGPLRFNLSAYAQWFDDYIYEAATGEEEDGLPVYQFRQTDARYYGIEGEIEARLVDTRRFGLTGNMVADYVDAELTDAELVDGGGNVPRIPPLRVRGGLSADAGLFGGRIEVEHVFEQDDVAAFETPTGDFTLVNASVQYHPFGERNETVLVLSANNIFDVDARRHASFTKDFVPLAGRDIRLSARVSF